MEKKNLPDSSRVTLSSLTHSRLFARIARRDPGNDFPRQVLSVPEELYIKPTILSWCQIKPYVMVNQPHHYQKAPCIDLTYYLQWYDPIKHIPN